MKKLFMMSTLAAALVISPVAGASDTDATPAQNLKQDVIHLEVNGETVTVAGQEATSILTMAQNVVNKMADEGSFSNREASPQQKQCTKSKIFKGLLIAGAIGVATGLTINAVTTPGSDRVYYAAGVGTYVGGMSFIGQMLVKDCLH
jgi:hypothetical protein